MGYLKLPFKVGEQIESRSFDQGYRGAWFRCTITGLRKIKGSFHYDLKFCDFPDEEIIPEQIFQKLSSGSSKSKKNRHLMMRPPFPPIHRESQMPNLDSILNVVVIVDDVWKVGDLVDWFTTGCFWSGTITEILGEEKVQIELLPPPAGEGSSYEAFCKDLRPSLDWSRELGWMVPNPTDNENHRCCARLIKPMSTGRADIEATTGAGSSLQDNVSFSSHLSASSVPSQGRSEETTKRPLLINDSKEKQTAEKDVDSMKFDRVSSDIGKTSCSDSVSSSHLGDASGEMAGAVAGSEQCNSGSSKKMRIAGTISLNSMRSDSLEAAIMDLEELVNRVKWLKRVLKFGMPLSSTTQPMWKFLEHCPTSTPK